MAIHKEIKTVRDLRRYKRRLRSEIDQSMEGINDQVQSFTSRDTLRKVLIGAAVAAAVTFGVRYLMARRYRQNHPQEAAARDYAQATQPSLITQFMPLIQTIVGFLVGLLKDRLMEQRNQMQQEQEQAVAP